MSAEMSDIRDVARDLMDLDYRMEQQIAEIRELLVTLQGEQAELRDEFHTHATSSVQFRPGHSVKA